MKTIVMLGMMLAGSSALFAQDKQKSCKDFKTGTFTNVDEETGASTLIERTATMQTESTDGGKNKTTFSLKWKDDCTFVLKPTKETLRKYKDWPKSTTFTITIAETMEDGYKQESSSTLSDVRVKNTLKKVK